MRRAASVALLCLTAFVLPAKAVDIDDVFGQYEEIIPAQPTAAKDKVEVLEVFWYGCPHCYRFQPQINAYEKNHPSYVNFHQMPAVLSPQWRPQAKIFYTAVAMKGLDKVHAPVFHTIHRDKKKLDSAEAVRGLFEEHGLDGKKFDSVFKSFGVDSQVRRAEQMTQRYGVNGVPMVIVNGRYRTGGALAGSYEDVMKVIDVLVEAERERMGLAK
jgi:thiol:disulfide interchange protein DsbA